MTKKPKKIRVSVCPFFHWVWILFGIQSIIDKFINGIYYYYNKDYDYVKNCNKIGYRQDKEVNEKDMKNIKISDEMNLKLVEFAEFQESSKRRFLERLLKYIDYEDIWRIWDRKRADKKQLQEEIPVYEDGLPDIFETEEEEEDLDEEDEEPDFKEGSDAEMTHYAKKEKEEGDRKLLREDARIKQLRQDAVMAGYETEEEIRDYVKLVEQRD